MDIRRVNPSKPDDTKLVLVKKEVADLFEEYFHQILREISNSYDDDFGRDDASAKEYPPSTYKGYILYNGEKGKNPNADDYFKKIKKYYKFMILYCILQYLLNIVMVF